jgi:hypothetical protein
VRRPMPAAQVRAARRLHDSPDPFLDCFVSSANAASNATRRKVVSPVRWILAADEFDRLNEGDFTTSHLMLWREEQRAIGELMRQDGNEPRCMSFNSFVENYDNLFSRWFNTFASELESTTAPRATD